jgi:hypothetical protein
MKKFFQFLFILFCFSPSNFSFAGENIPKIKDLMQIFESTADHKKFKELQTNFQSSQEVTKACLSCHNQAAQQIHKDIHWTWDFKNDKQELGKKVSINNF